MKRLRSLLLSLLMAPALLAAPYTAIKDGEAFRFRAGWGVFTNAAEISVSARKGTWEGKDVFRIAMVTKTRGVVGGLYPYEEKAEAIIDANTGRLLVATDKSDNGDQSMDSTMSFDYETRVARFRDKFKPGRNGDVSLPDGDPVDLISALIQSREFALEPGAKREAVVFAGRDVYPINIYADRYEDITYRGRDISTLLMIPRMEAQSPRGIFRKGGQVKVWVAKEEDRLPVKMQLKLNFGTATLTLIEHTKPTPAGSVASN